MAKLDHKLRTAPNTTLHNLEGTILYQNNHTSQWLAGKPEEEKNAIIDKVVREKKRKRCEEKDRRDDLQHRHRKIIAEREHTVMKKREDRLKDREETVQNVDEMGVWTKDKKDEGLTGASTKEEQMSLLKKQCSVIKELYDIPKDNKCLTLYSHKGKCFSVEQLKDNLQQLILVATLKEKPKYSMYGMTRVLIRSGLGTS